MSLAARLVLWDVDRTLLDVGGISRQIYAEAFQAVTGRRLERLADLAGRTDRDIILTTLALHGLRPGQGMLEAFLPGAQPGGARPAGAHRRTRPLRSRRETGTRRVRGAAGGGADGGDRQHPQCR